MRQTLFALFITLSVIFVYPSFVAAHPGRTAADGCHYCRTNCDSWGVAWNERHCHNEPVQQIFPTSVPTRIPTKKITKPKRIVQTVTPQKKKAISKAKKKATTTPKAQYTCNCRKTCSQLSCAEAYFQLNQCGCSVRDGDDDGVPCEEKCG